jgi:adenylate cyclase
MADLIAQGPQADQRWRRSLPSNTMPAMTESGTEFFSIVIGRGVEPWCVPWDDRISRRHARIEPAGERWIIERLPEARNPVFFRGQRQDRFTVGPGEHFVIGRTTFTIAQRPLAADNPAMISADVTEQVFDRQQLRRAAFRDAPRRIEVLARLPDLITGSGGECELLVRVSNVLLQGIPEAAAVAIVCVPEGDAENAETVEVTLLQYDHRVIDAEGPRPSAKLVRQALSRGESLLHLWSGGSTNSAYTESEGVDWAFCVPVPTDACRGWGLYVTGSVGGVAPSSLTVSRASEELQDEVKFTEIVATTLGNLRKTRQLERRQTGLRRFFAPVVLDALGEQDPDRVLEPREADVSVMFCDLRGFSRQSEQQANQLMQLLERVSQALGVMTRHILDRGGVIGDFHGDAAMGFWGWPLAQGDAPQRACSAALAVLQEFTAAASDPSHRLYGFRCGIGVASGRAVAGRIGTIDQVKVTAFGPVVNLASRLESMTKTLRAEILLDEPTAEMAKKAIPRSVGRIRRLLKVRPFGMTQVLTVSQLLPPYGAACPLTDEHLTEYEAALDALTAGEWAEAFDRLHRVPPDDRAKDFLTALIAQHGRMAPVGWNGVIDLSKG